MCIGQKKDMKSDIRYYGYKFSIRCRTSKQQRKRIHIGIAMKSRSKAQIELDLSLDLRYYRRHRRGVYGLQDCFCYCKNLFFFESLRDDSTRRISEILYVFRITEDSLQAHRHADDGFGVI
jgi:hypothetical protein